MKETQRTKTLRLKVLLLGPTSSGKTTFLKAVTTTDSLLPYDPTSGTTFHNHNSKMMWPTADIFIHFVDTSEAVSHSAEYVQALMNKVNIVIVFFDCSNRESIAKGQNIIISVIGVTNKNGLRIPA